MKVLIFYGSVRETRQGINAARFIENKIKERKINVELIDPLVYNLPMLDKMHKEYTKDNVPKKMDELSKKILDADGFIIVTGEYNHSIPPALKNMLDHYQREYNFKPSAIVSYSAGSFGGVRSAVHLRAILGELGMSSIPSMFPVPFVQDAFTEEGVPIDEKYNSRIKRFLDEFEWYLKALKEQRLKGTPY
ncbi:NAD(P)H-dependent oxidoreductase [Candidatus Woesearchaeota archaeon]|nr:NAD(P)H-dependent oxidoreductase [Candidatus Woesearchaeota archaeon]